MGYFHRGLFNKEIIHFKERWQGERDGWGTHLPEEHKLNHNRFLVILKDAKVINLLERRIALQAKRLVHGRKIRPEWG